jgi:hypothetical protein
MIADIQKTIKRENKVQKVLNYDLEKSEKNQANDVGD